MNKSLLSNLIALLIVLVGYLLKYDILLTIGLFALSGSLTNYIAIHMLFEKVPFFYGSGVIENRFEEFKTTIQALIMNQFFNKANLTKFLENEINSKDKNIIDLSILIGKTNLKPAFDSLIDAVMESSFGSMLNMFGGPSALNELEKPFISKLTVAIGKIVNSDTFQINLKKSINSGNVTDEMHEKLERIVKTRLDELSPKIVKNIIEEMIRNHLGWLVVWGAFFGGLIGLASSFIY